MATYGMTKVSIEEKRIAGTTTTFLVYADTARFGKHEIMAQLPTVREAEEWLRANGVTEYAYKLKTATPGITVSDVLEQELETGCGKVQIGNRMFRHLTREKDGSVWGHGNEDGWTPLDRYFSGAILTGSKTAKVRGFNGMGYLSNLTIKFGTACTW